MGKARQRKQNKAQIVETLTSAKFQAHIQKTLMNVPLELVELLIRKSRHDFYQGVTEKWVGIMTNAVEIRIGYERNGNCYTMLILNGVSHCYDFSKENTCTPMRLIPSPPSQITVQCLF